MKDRFGRDITYLRISVTDLCNLRCKYCMPESGVESLCHSDILSLEEIVEIVKVAAKNGITKIRLTGGEPLVRRGFVHLCKEISKIEQIEDIAITTNGVHLKNMADDLFENKVKRINFSLDTLVKEKYNDITRRNDFDREIKFVAKVDGVTVEHNYVEWNGSYFYPIETGFIIKPQKNVVYSFMGIVPEGIPEAILIISYKGEQKVVSIDWELETGENGENLDYYDVYF